MRRNFFLTCAAIVFLLFSGCVATSSSEDNLTQSLSPTFKDYQSTVYHFSIKYPADWLPHENVIPETVGFLSPEGSSSQADIGINYVETGFPNSLGSIKHHEELMSYATSTLEVGQGCKVVKTSQISVRTNSGYVPAYKSKLECPKNDLYIVKVVANNGQYTLSFGVPSGSTQYGSIIDQMFGSFKIEKDDLNEEYVKFTDKSTGYVIDYPYFWRVYPGEGEKSILELFPPEDDETVLQFRMIPIGESYTLESWTQYAKDNLVQFGEVTGETQTTVEVVSESSTLEIPATQFTSDLSADGETLKVIYKFFIYNGQGYILYFVAPDSTYLNYRTQALDIIRNFQIVK